MGNIIPQNCLENKFSLKSKTFKFNELDKQDSTTKREKSRIEEKSCKKDGKFQLESDPFYQKYLPSFQKNYENFTKDLLKEINKVRFNCKEYSKKIDNFANNLKTNFFTKEKYFLFENYPIYLNIGEKEFSECSSYLKNLYSKKENLTELVNVEELKVPFPEYIDNWDDDEYIKNTMRKNMINVNGKFNLVEFNYFKSILNPEISVILSLLNQDENKNSIRNTIFMKEIKNIGINYQITEENYCVLYINFAE